MMLPVVICLNHLKSSGKCHGILLPLPITRFSDMAAMALKCFIKRLFLLCGQIAISRIRHIDNHPKTKHKGNGKATRRGRIRDCLT